MKKVIPMIMICFLMTVSGWSMGRAMWEWNYKDATDTTNRKELLDFCKAHNIVRIYLQLAYDWSSSKDGVVTCTLDYNKEIHDFLGEAHKAGIKVDALDGAAKLALKEWHPHVLSQVDAILAFNKAGKPDEQYDGIHFDIEPYGLKIFQENRVSICSQFLELVTACEDKIKQSGQKVILGLAIPMWYDENKDEKGNLLYSFS